jgi:uncharacterized protein YbaR (Trm112 family)
MPAAPYADRQETLMLEPDFVAILRCLETGSELSLLDTDALHRLNTAITAGKVSNQMGQRLERPLEAALINADATRVYQVLDGIPILLAEQAIPYQESMRGP